MRVMKMLLDAGASTNAVTKQGWTPLHYAAFDQKKQPMEVLIAAKANLDVQEEVGPTCKQASKPNHERASICAAHSCVWLVGWSRRDGRHCTMLRIVALRLV